MAKTPAVAAAERAGVAFQIHSYEPDPKRESFGLEAVDKLGLDAARVFKTLVVDHEGRLGIAIVPVTSQLDLKALGKRVAMADPQAAERTTGYVLGGISPLGSRHQLPTTIDESALDHDTWAPLWDDVRDVAEDLLDIDEGLFAGARGNR